MVTIDKEVGISVGPSARVEVSNPTIPLTIKLSCGERREYATTADVPLESVECMCGRVTHPHFFIEYGQ